MKPFFACALFFLLATSVAAEERQSTTSACEQLLQAYGRIEIKAAQADLVDGVQKGIIAICQRLIETEKAAPVPSPSQTPKVSK